MHGTATTHHLHPARTYDDGDAVITVVREPDAWLFLREEGAVTGDDRRPADVERVRLPAHATDALIDLLDRTGAPTFVFERLPKAWGVDGSVHYHRATDTVGIVVGDRPAWWCSRTQAQRVVDDLLLHTRAAVPWGPDTFTPGPIRPLATSLFGERIPSSTPPHHGRAPLTPRT